MPESAQEHPDYWITLGLWAQRHNQTQAAARCFWEALRREPTHRLANYQLSVALAADGKPEAAKPFEELSTRSANLNATIDALFSAQARRPAHDAAGGQHRPNNSGRYWEAMNWHRLVLLKAPDDAESQLAVARLQLKLGPDMPRIDPNLDPANQLDLSSYPLPRMDAADGSRVACGGEVSGRRRDPLWRCDASLPDWTFTYFAGDDPETPGRRMFEFTGGGVAVLDYDTDGWPDIYFTQGIHWPRREGQPLLRDQLFRNLGRWPLRECDRTGGTGR